MFKFMHNLINFLKTEICSMQVKDATFLEHCQQFIKEHFAHVFERLQQLQEWLQENSMSESAQRSMRERLDHVERLVSAHTPSHSLLNGSLRYAEGLSGSGASNYQSIPSETSLSDNSTKQSKTASKTSISSNKIDSDERFEVYDGVLTVLNREMERLTIDIARFKADQQKKKKK